jgi:hypothetical protein
VQIRFDYSKDPTNQAAILQAWLIPVSKVRPCAQCVCCGRSLPIVLHGLRVATIVSSHHFVKIYS